MLHIYNGLLLSHKKNSCESVELRWMKLKLAILSEVGQGEKNKFHILMHIYGI